MTTVLGVALDAREILRRGWTQGSDESEALLAARDAVGKPCGVLSPKARSFTVVGALLRATDADARTPQSIAVYEALRAHLGERPLDWGNAVGRTQREVLAAFDAVVAKLQADAEVAGG